MSRPITSIWKHAGWRSWLLKFQAAFDHRPRSRFPGQHRRSCSASVWRRCPRLSRQLHGFRAIARRRTRTPAAMAAKQQAQVAHIQQFVDRFRAKASRANRYKAASKHWRRCAHRQYFMLILAIASVFQNLKVSNPLFSFRNLSLGYGDSTVLRNIEPIGAHRCAGR